MGEVTIMKKILYLFTFLTLLSFASKANAQGVAYHDIAFYNSNGNVRVVASALITVCASGWTSPPPCAPALGGTLFSNFALTNSISNPFNADANGNFNFIAASGNYTVCITGAGVNGTCNQVTLGGGGGGTIGGSVANNQVAVGSGVNTVSSSGNFTWNGSTLFLNNPILATNILNQSSPVIQLTGNVWNGSSSVTDNWTVQDLLTGGSRELHWTWNSSTGTQTSFSIPNTLTIRNDGGNSAQTCYQGGSSGSFCWTVAATAGSPNGVALPTANPTALGQALGIAGLGAPEGTAWINVANEICSGQIALTTGAIGSGARATNTLTCTGLSTSTDSISCSFNSDTNAVVGYAPSASGGLSLKTWVSTNTINVDQINDTSGSITPGAATINCRGLR
jgi:hypothetical protein